MNRLAKICLLAGLAIASAQPGLGAEKVLPQGWSQQDRNGWYWGSQGSRLLPEAWFDALEQPTSTAMLADPAFLATFGYLPAPDGSHRYPIGFAIDRQDDDAFAVTKLRWYQGQRGGHQAEPWVGMNCSACHTAQLTYKGTSFRVDGGPSLTDFQSLIETIDAALNATRSNQEKWNRFASRVLKGKDTATNRSLLQAELGRMIKWQERTDALNTTPLRYGFGRVDAFGHIFNKIVLFSGSDNSMANPADAPVSFPFLWNIQRQSSVQWNGIAPNSKIRLRAGDFDYGAIGRNTGEVLGVFGEIMIAPQTGLFSSFGGYVSSVDIKNLNRMESLVKQLQPPKWPREFPPIDRKLASKGAALFEANCSNCHISTTETHDTERMQLFRTASDKTDITDVWMACNAYTYAMRRGNLTDRNTKADDLIPVSDALTGAVKGAMYNRKTELIGIALGKIFGGDTPPPTVIDHVWSGGPRSIRDQRYRLCLNADNKFLAYKARPLDGIWATAPYLHDGSVPTLYDLLLPAKERPRQFYVGNREYDPKRVGYVSDVDNGPATFLFKTTDGDGGPIDGNGNQGHEYHVGSLSDADRWALVEYLKSL